MTPRDYEEMLDKITIINNLCFAYLMYYYYFNIVILFSVLDQLYRPIVPRGMQTLYSVATEPSKRIRSVAQTVTHVEGNVQSSPKLILHNVLYVQNLAYNLFSVSQLQQKHPQYGVNIFYGICVI